MELTGWGRFPRAQADVFEPAEAKDIVAHLRDQAMPCIARGSGLSYGDSALAQAVICSRSLPRFIEFDPATLQLRCAAGVRLDEILDEIVPHGAFLPVLPGARQVTVGGAIAADIHGKNHHLDGAFSDHVDALTLILASGDTVQCSRQLNPGLFAATCGGMGLTGIIVAATIRLATIPGPYIRTRTLSAGNLQHCMDLLTEHRASKYSVAWVDCLARGSRLGRGIVYLGEHDQDRNGQHSRPAREARRISIPFSTPAFLLNRFSVVAFNNLYFSLQSRRQEDSLHFNHYFFPLDRIKHWNRLYGRHGFLQYQLVLPAQEAAVGIRQILERVAAAGQGSFLAVLKQFGPGNGNPLSFPRDGFTLALDFKRNKRVLKLLNDLDELVLAHGGRLYLAKDARMPRCVFTSGYPRWQEFLQLKQEVDPHNRFTSLQAQRLGLISDS